jgi:hypothetical protein
MKYSSLHFWKLFGVLLIVLFWGNYSYAQSQTDSPRLILEDTIPGYIHDISSDRILYSNDKGVFIRNRQSGEDELISQSINLFSQVRTGSLIPDGALFIGWLALNRAGLFQWKNGELRQIKKGDNPAYYPSYIIVRGDYAIWNEYESLYRMDLRSGEDLLITTNAASAGNDLAVNGDVVYMTNQYQIARWRNGETIIFPTEPNFWSIAPYTDGTNIVYSKVPPCCKEDVPPSSIWLITPSGEFSLGKTTSATSTINGDYKLNNGWVAYRKTDGFWLRSPDGLTRLITTDQSKRVSLLSSNGEVLLKKDNDHIYLASSKTDQPVAIGPSLYDSIIKNEGKPFWRDGVWYIAYPNGQLYRIAPDWASPYAYNQSLKDWKNDPLPVTLKTDSPQGRPLTYSVGTPAHGSLTGTPPNLTYQPNPDFAGADSFTFQASDGTLNSQTATVSINVADPQLLIGSDSALPRATVSLPVRLAPLAGNVASLDIHFHVDKAANAPSVAPTLSLTDTTAGWQVVRDMSDPLHISIANASGASGDAALLTITFTIPSLTPPGTIYTISATDAKAADEFGHSRSITGSVKEGRVLVQNVVPVANDLSIPAFQDHPISVMLQATSGDSDPLTYHVVTLPAHGTLSGTPPHLTYMPESGFAGEDAFTFAANDTHTDSAPATVSLHVQPALLTIGSATTGQGEGVELPISITDAASSVNSLDLTLTSNVTSLEPQWRLADDGADWQLQVDPNNPRHVTLSRETPVSGPSTLLWLSVRPPANATIGTTIPVDVSSLQLNTLPVMTEKLRVSPGVLTIETCHERIRGDLNGDGVVGIGDAILALRMAVLLNEPSNECQRAASDVNCDGVQDIGDAVLILRNIAFHEEFPACSG